MLDALRHDFSRGAVRAVWRGEGIRAIAKITEIGCVLRAGLWRKNKPLALSY